MFDGQKLVINETIDAKKLKLAHEKVWSLLNKAREIVVGRGKKILVFTPSQSNKEEILKHSLGRTGNLRAPALKIGNRYIIGFNEDMYRKYVGKTFQSGNNSMVDINLHLKNKLQGLDDKGLLRRVVPLKHLELSRVGASGQTWVNLSGNDYLGLAANREMVHAFYRQVQPETLLENFGPGAAASRLMTGNSPLYSRLENKLASLYGKERCLVFNSGYHGNAGILPALTTKKDLILADKLCHASLIDGMRLSMTKTLRFRHLDYDHLEEILSTRRDRYNQVFLVSESIFSMDGDTAELDKLIALKRKYQCCLYLDEAHAVGVLGRQGLGLAEQQGVIDDIDLLFGTFGKALAGVGGFVACSETIADYLVNRARTLIFTTGLPPVCLSWLLFVLDRVPSMEEERNRLQMLADKMRKKFARQGLPVRGNSQIVPVIIGDSAQAMSAAGKLQDLGYWVNAVRPPTVPEGTARLRLSFSAAMNENDLAPLPELLSSVLQ